jgi:hypothetical protein
MELERLTGESKLPPPSFERAKKISPPWDPPEKTISCQTTYSRLGSSAGIAARGSHEKTPRLFDTLTGASSVASPVRS